MVSRYSPKRGISESSRAVSKQPIPFCLNESHALILADRPSISRKNSLLISSLSECNLWIAVLCSWAVPMEKPPWEKLLLDSCRCAFSTIVLPSSRHG